MRQPVPFGKYLLLDRISVGGMAEVFKAKSYGVEGFEKIIAIKRILPTMGEDRDFIKMFIDEAKIAGQLAHANICQIFELGRIDGSHFIAMEYIWGKDLLQIQNRLRKIKQQMPVPMACFVIAKVLEGLDYAHRKRDPLGRPLEIVHRDCSPQNVLVSYEGEVKVIDFGIAKATSRNSRTMAGVLKGKFGYMSPEQVRGLPLDRRSDIFALGTMIYECLTSERLFQGETDFSTLEKVRNVDIRPPRELNPNIPEAVERVILKALAKDVDDRYQWCSEMLGDLQQYLMSQDVVFTAKQLSAWLKEVFSNEIDKERQQLETYKRVGRDGLIQGVPAAEAKLDVVEHLGEAGAPEGDATQLGGPSFDDIENAIGASAAVGPVGPALGSPAARGSRPASRGDHDDGDFGEEAPTEIFGELDNAGDGIPTPPVAASRPVTSSPNRPPKPPPGSGQRPVSMPGNGRPSVNGGMAAVMSHGGSEQTMNVTDAELAAAEQAPYAAAARASNQAPASYPATNQPPGYPMAPPQVANALAPAGAPNSSKTLMGQMAPPGLGVYQQTYNNASYPQHGHSGVQGVPGMPGPPTPPAAMQGVHPNPSGPMGAMGMNPSQPQMLAHPSGQIPNMGYPDAQGYVNQMQAGYNQYQNLPVPAVEPAEPRVEGRKKSSILRDVLIGVAIAAIVLGGFLAVKFLILDADDEAAVASGGDEPASQITSLKIELKPDLEAELFLDDNKTREHVVKNGLELPITAGDRKIKIVSKDGQVCERQLKLEAGKTTVFSCEFNTTPTGSGSGSGSDAGSAAAAGSGSAGSAAGSGSGSAGAGAGSAGAGSGSAMIASNGTGSGSAATVKPPDKTPDKTPIVKQPDKTPSPIVKQPDKNDKNDKNDNRLDLTNIGAKPDKKPRDKLPPEDKGHTASSEATVMVSSKPKAKIAVDGTDTGQSTPAKIKLTPGRHKIQFSWGTAKSVFPITVKAGETVPFHKDLE